MKTNKLFAMLAFATVLFASCQEKEPTPGDGDKDDPDKEEPVVKSAKCKLESLVVVGVSGEEYETKLYTNDKVAELVYLNDIAADLTAATLKWTVSEKATVDVAEDKVYNLLEEKPEFTITSEDGEHTAKWSVEAVLAQVSISCDLVDENVPGKFGITTVSPSGASVAFCGVDKIATINGEVYDFNGNKVGDLNREGLPEGAKIFNMNNDVNGVVVASFGFKSDGTPAAANDDIQNTNGWGCVYCWKDGYDKAPTLIYTNANNAEDNRGNTIGYMNCGGDVNGDFILTSIFGGRTAAQSFHTFSYHNGNFSVGAEWKMFATTYAGNDGCWGATISPASGDINGTFFICDSMGDNKGTHVYAREGYQDVGEDVALKGTTMTTCPGVSSAGIPDGNAEYGNYSTGNIKAFMYNGVPCVAVASTGWPEVYLTIQTNDPSDEENHYILETQYYAAPAVVPSVAYVYDPATDTGNVLLLGGTLVLNRYEITRELL